MEGSGHSSHHMFLHHLGPHIQCEVGHLVLLLELFHLWSTSSLCKNMIKPELTIEWE